MDDPFYVSEEANIVSSDALARLQTLAQETLDNENFIKELEEQITELKADLNRKKTNDLPDLMAEIGFSEFVHGGKTFYIKNFVSGSLPKESEKRAAGIKWLEDNDAEDIIKSEITLFFGKNEHNRFHDILGYLEKEGIDAQVKTGVHPQTLISHISERLEKGQTVPLDLLGLYAGRIVKIEEKRQNKKDKGNLHEKSIISRF